METNGNGQLNGSNVYVVSDYLDKATQNLKERLKKNPLILSGKGEEARRDKIFHILVIEDCTADVEYIRQALKQTNVNFELITISTGDDAMKYLNRQSPYEKSPVPDLIVLDLFLPNHQGKDILSYVKSNRHLSWIPLIAISEEENIGDESFAHAKKVNSYLTKPFKIADFYTAFLSANKFWFMNENLAMAK